MLRIFFICAAVLLVLSVSWYSINSDNQAQRIVITDAIAVPLKDQSDMLMVTMKLENVGAAVNITGVSSSQSAKASFMGKEEQRQIAVPEVGKASFSGDGIHIMMMGVDGDLAEGRLLPITLTAGDGTTLVTKARISKQLAMMHGMHGSGMSMKMAPKIEGEPPVVSVSATAKSAGWDIAVDVKNFRFAKELVDGDHLSGTGHGHIYLNGLKLGRLYSNNYKIGSLPKGKHLIRVTLNSNDHKVYMNEGSPITATAEIEVK